MTTPETGHVYRMEHPDYGRLHCLAVAVQQFAGMEKTFLAVRVTVTGQRFDFPHWIRMNSGDPCAGYIIAYDLDRVETEELAEDLGALSVNTWLETKAAIRRVFGL